MIFFAFRKAASTHTAREVAGMGLDGVAVGKTSVSASSSSPSFSSSVSPGAYVGLISNGPVFGRGDNSISWPSNCGVGTISSPASIFSAWASSSRNPASMVGLASNVSKLVRGDTSGSSLSSCAVGTATGDGGCGSKVGRTDGAGLGCLVNELGKGIASVRVTRAPTIEMMKSRLMEKYMAIWYASKNSSLTGIAVEIMTGGNRKNGLVNESRLRRVVRGDCDS